jgi:hypothetical protein
MRNIAEPDLSRWVSLHFHARTERIDSIRRWEKYMSADNFARAHAEENGSADAHQKFDLSSVIYGFESKSAPHKPQQSVTSDLLTGSSRTESQPDSARIILANAWLDSHHHIEPPPRPIERQEPVEKRDKLADIISGAAYLGHFGKDDEETLRMIFAQDFHRKWWQGESVADQINERLEKAHAPYRVDFTGPFKTKVEPPYGAKVYNYTLGVRDVNSQQKKASIEMNFVKED